MKLRFEGSPHPDYEQFQELREEPRNASRRIEVRVLESVCDATFVTYECVSPKWRVLIRVLNLECDLNSLRKSVFLLHQSNYINFAICMDIGREKAEYIRTMAIHKVLSLQGIALPLNTSLFQLDVAFFKDCYIYFHERTMQMMDFMAHVSRTSYNHAAYTPCSPDFYSLDKLQSTCHEAMNRMHNLRIIQLGLTEEGMSYSLTLHRPVWEGFEVAACYYENQGELMSIREALPKVKYQSKQYENCQSVLTSPKMLEKYNDYELNLYDEDYNALKESLKALEHKLKVSLSTNGELKEQFRRALAADKQVIDVVKLQDPAYDAVMLSQAYFRPFCEVLKMTVQHSRTPGFIHKHASLLVQLYEEQNRSQDAYELNSYLLGEDTGNLLLKVKLTETCLETNKLQQARTLLQQLPKTLVASRLLSAKLLILQGSYSKAESLLKGLVKRLGHTAEHQLYPLLLLGELHQRTSNTKRATDCFRQCLAICEELRAKGSEKAALASLKQLHRIASLNLCNLSNGPVPEAYLQSSSSLLAAQQALYGIQAMQTFSLHYNRLLASLADGDLKLAAALLRVCQAYFKQPRLLTSNELVTHKLKLIQAQLSLLSSQEPLRLHEQDQLGALMSAGALSLELYLNYESVSSIDRSQHQFPMSSPASVVQFRKRLGLRLLSLGKVAEAREELSKAASFLSHNIKKASGLDVTVRLSELLARLHDPSSEGSLFLVEALRCLVDEPYFTNRLKGVFYFLCGLQHLRLELWQESLDSMGKAQLLYGRQLMNELPNRGAVMERIDAVTLALYTQLRMHDKIRRLYVQAIEQDVQRPDMYKFLADLAFEQMSYAEAASYYKRYIKNLRYSRLSQRNIIAESEFRIAVCYGKMKDMYSSLQYYLKAEKYLDDPSIVKQIAEIYMNRKQYSLAYEYFSRLQHGQYPLVSKEQAKLSSCMTHKSSSLRLHLDQYMKWLGKDRQNPQVDPDVYEFMAHNTSLPLDIRILCLSKYLRMTELRKGLTQGAASSDFQATLSANNELLADLYYEKQDYENAKMHYQKLAAMEPSLAGKLIGRIFNCSLRLDINSEDLELETLKARSVNGGPFHPDTIEVALLLAERVFKEERYVQAFLYYAHAIQVRKYSSDKSIVPRIFKALGNVARESASYRERAERLQQRYPWLGKVSSKLHRLVGLVRSFIASSDPLRMEFRQELLMECLMICPSALAYFDGLITGEEASN